MKFLDGTGLGRVWNKVKTLVGAKQDTLVSGTNIKTINNQSVLGSGNLTISGGVEVLNRTVTYSNDEIVIPNISSNPTFCIISLYMNTYSDWLANGLVTCNAYSSLFVSGDFTEDDDTFGYCYNYLDNDGLHLTFYDKDGTNITPNASSMSGLTCRIVII